MSKQLFRIKPKSRTIHIGDVMDVLARLPTNSIDEIVTSPMYYNDIDLGVPGAWGNERSVFEYLSKMRTLQNELYRILKSRGTCFINLSDSYAKKNHGSIKKGTKLMVPEQFSSQCVLDGWICENVIQWLKRDAFPTSIQSHLWENMEPVYFLTKKKQHYFNLQAVKIPRLHKSKSVNRRVRDASKGSLHKRFGKNAKASDKEIKKFKQDQRGKAHYTGFNGRYNATKTDKNPGCLLDISRKKSDILSNHLATYPVKFAEWFIKCGCPKNGIVLDPFMGSGSTAIAAENLGRKWMGDDGAGKPNINDIRLTRIIKGDQLEDELASAKYFEILFNKFSIIPGSKIHCVLDKFSDAVNYPTLDYQTATGTYHDSADGITWTARSGDVKFKEFAAKTTHVLCENTVASRKFPGMARQMNVPMGNFASTDLALVKLAGIAVARGKQRRQYPSFQVSAPTDVLGLGKTFRFIDTRSGLVFSPNLMAYDLGGSAFDPQSNLGAKNISLTIEEWGY